MFHSGGEFYLLDNAKWAIKSVFSPNKTKKITKIEKRPFNSEIIGEVHIKDLTQNINMEEKGTYLGAANFAKTLKDLGITMVEFLPLNEFDSKQNGTNHWGYMPLGYFSLARKYAYDKSLGNLFNEFHQMIDEFHKNGLKVCLDMVYNHTGEAGLINNNRDDANLLSYALIDNNSYYKVFGNGYYRSNSGCGNDFNANDSGVMNLIVDSLIFWINQGVDAFRFDLAAALLENSCDCREIYDNINSLAARLQKELKERSINVVDNFESAQDGVILIAEPWTCGGRECYQLGNFPPFWAEWNDVFRDTSRKLTIKPDEVTPKQIRDIFEGTPSKFKGFDKSINYVSSHDGHTLRDLNSYNPKSHWEIAFDFDNNHTKRENSIRKQLAFLFLSYGIPMVQIGDIIMHTKNGNSNSYNKDDSTNYLCWQEAFKDGTFENRIMNYTKSLIRFRKNNPIFSSREFLKKVTYHYDNAEIADFENLGYWNNRYDAFFGALINASEKRIYVASNKSNNPIVMKLPKTNLKWFKCLDTSDLSDIDLDKKDCIDFDYILNENALALFIEE